MLKSIENLFYYLIDAILPTRKDFSIVRNLDESEINSLPKAKNVDGMDWIHPLFNYRENKVRAIIWELKYKENTIPLDIIGKILYEEIVALISDIIIFDSNAEFLIIPIPISKERRIERGYNQSEYIAKSIIENDLGRYLIYAPQWLEKTKDTPIQSRSKLREERLKNIKGCFSADKRVLGKYIILIDDVVTTGSTLKEASDTLMKCGAKSVVAFTIAH